MALVAGVDFGTLSARVTLLDSERGRLGTALAEFPLHRRREDPDFATQSHADHLTALTAAMHKVLAETGVNGQEIVSLALDTTGSSVIPVDEHMQPLGEYYLWCDHRAKREAREITALAHAEGLEAIHWCGGVYSHEWGFAKLLHFLRHNPELRPRFASAFEHCDMIAATLCGITNPAEVKRSVCAMGHKWLWNPHLKNQEGGFPPQSFLSRLDPLFDGIVEKLAGPVLTSDHLAGHLSEHWASELDLRPGIPIPVGAFDAHWDAIGAGCRAGDVVNVIGTSTCIIAMQPPVQNQEDALIPGVCGVVPAIARRAGTSVKELARGLESYGPGQTGLLRLTWDNGDRTVLVNSDLAGITLGWRLTHTAQDELFAAMEGTAFHTRIILERMAEHGVPIERVINAGGIPQHNATLNQVYANVLGKPVVVPDGIPTSLGSGIFAMLAAGVFPSIEAAQQKLCLPFRTFHPQPDAVAVYERLYGHFRSLYHSFGSGGSVPPLGELFHDLQTLATESYARKLP
jgi:L-ribulokinase